MTNGLFQGSNDNSNYITIHTISTQPTSNVWTEVAVAVNYRYVKYVSPESPTKGYCNVAEIEFWTPVTTVISTNKNASDLGLTPESKVNVSSGVLLTVNQTTSINSLTVEQGGKVTINNGISFSGSTVTLKSSASGTATLVDSYTSPTVTATIQQYLPQGRNWYVATPFESTIAPAQASSLIGGGLASSVSYYDETQNGTVNAWVNNYTGNMLRGVGYVAVSAAGGGTSNISLTGKLNSGNVPVTLTRTGTGSFAGYNLIANPYPSYVNPMAALNALNVEKTIWYRTKGTIYKFETVNTTTGVGTNNASTGTVTGYIPPLQAFWVRTNANGQVLTFTNTMREHANPTGVTTTPMKARQQEVNSIARLKINGIAGSDEAVLYFNNAASNAFDNYNSRKMFESEAATTPELFLMAGAEKLTIDGLNTVPYESEIPMGFVTKQTGDFSISANEFSNFESGTRLFIKDNLYPSAEVEITPETAYSFSVSNAAVNTDRFSLLFRAPGSNTGLNTAEKLNAQVFVNAANQITIIAPEKCNYAIYNTVGQKVMDGFTSSNRTTLNTLFESGMYIINVSENGKNFISKVIVK